MGVGGGGGGGGEGSEDMDIMNETRAKLQAVLYHQLTRSDDWSGMLQFLRQKLPQSYSRLHYRCRLWTPSILTFSTTINETTTGADIAIHFNAQLG